MRTITCAYNHQHDLSDYQISYLLVAAAMIVSNLAYFGTIFLCRSHVAHPARPLNGPFRRRQPKNFLKTSHCASPLIRLCTNDASAARAAMARGARREREATGAREAGRHGCRHRLTRRVTHARTPRTRGGV